MRQLPGGPSAVSHDASCKLFNPFKLCNAWRMRQRHGQSDTGRDITTAYRALVGFTALVAAVTFVLSFLGLYDYGWRVAGVPTWLAWLVPVGVDGLTLVAVAATYALRHEVFRARAYAWSVFAVAVLASTLGNLSHAVARGLTWEGQVGAAAWPALLALASHLAIVAKRHLERAGVAEQRDAPPVPVATSTPSAPTASPATSSPVAPKRPAAKTQPIRTARDSDSDLRATARDMYLGGERRLVKIAMKLNTSKRTVERWTKDLRATADATDTAKAADPETAAAAAN